jgi:hypothetical protein
MRNTMTFQFYLRIKFLLVQKLKKLLATLEEKITVFYTTYRNIQQAMSNVIT